MEIQYDMKQVGEPQRLEKEQKKLAEDNNPKKKRLILKRMKIQMRLRTESDKDEI